MRVQKIIPILFLYFAIRIVIRALVSDSVSWDEAEQLLFSQHLQWGYDSQPPLYTWIQSLAFALFGQSVFSLSLVKESLVFSNFVLLYHVAKLTQIGQTYALLSAGSLFLVYEYCWEQYKRLTHSVLVVMACALTMYLFLKILEKPRPRNYLAFGLALAIGVLSKYNYLIFLAALVLAALPTKATRDVLLRREMSWAVLLALALLSPHLWWVSQHLSWVMIDTTSFNQTSKFHGSATVSGVWQLIRKSVFMLLPLLVAYGLFFRKGFTSTPEHHALQEESQDPIAPFFSRFFVAAFLLAAALILIFHVHNIKYHWLHPFFIFVPTYFFYRLANHEQQVSAKSAQFLGNMIVGMALAVPIIFLVRERFPDLYKCTELTYPYRDLAQQIRAAGFERGLIIADHWYTGGDLKLQFQDSLVLTDKVNIPPPHDSDSLLLAWQPSGHGVPDEITRMATKLGLSKAVFETPPMTAKALRHYSHNHYYSIEFLLLKKNSAGQYLRYSSTNTNYDSNNRKI